MSATKTETDVNLHAVTGNAGVADQGIEFGTYLMRFAESVAHRDAKALGESRQALLEAAGATVLIEAAGVAANFQRMVRIADSIGIPYDDMTSDLGQQIRADLNLNSFAGADHSGVG